MTCGTLCVVLGSSCLASGAAWGAFMLAFGVFTVRRLRRHPDAGSRLGIALYPGWDIMCVAAALSLPRRMVRRRDSGPLAAFRAHSETMYRHTSALDQYLARACYWSHMLFCALILVACVVYVWP